MNLAFVIIAQITVCTFSYDGNYSAAFGWWVFSIAMIACERLYNDLQAALKLARECADGWRESNESLKTLLK